MPTPTYYDLPKQFAWHIAYITKVLNPPKGMPLPCCYFLLTTDKDTIEGFRQGTKAEVKTYLQAELKKYNRVNIKFHCRSYLTISHRQYEQEDLTQGIHINNHKV